MECSQLGAAVEKEAVPGVSVRTSSPQINLSHLGSFEVRRTATSARILKLPPGYVILQDAQGSFKGLARIPMNITNPTPPQTVQSAEELLPKQKSPVPVNNSISTSLQGSECIQQHHRDGVIPVDGNTLGLSSQPGVTIPSSQMPQNASTVACGKNLIPSAVQETEPAFQKPSNDAPSVSGQNRLIVPPGYVIVKDGRGSVIGLARVPTNISNPIPIQPTKPAEDLLRNKRSPVAIKNSLGTSLQNSESVHQRLRDEVIPVDAKASGMSSQPSITVSSSLEPKIALAAVIGKNFIPSTVQGAECTSKKPPNDTSLVSGKNCTTIQLQRANPLVPGSQEGIPRIRMNPVAIQPKGPLPRQPWVRDPPNWKKEPIVLYSGAPRKKDADDTDDPDEDNKPKSGRGKKLPPPKGLPCPKILDDILPQLSYKYHISSFEELTNPAQFKAEVRVNITQKEAALQWLREFEEKSGTNFRIAKTFKEKSLRLIFKKTFRCHKNTYRKKTEDVAKRETERNVGCPSRLSITVKNPEMKTSTDALLSEFPCVICIYHNHCHSLTTLDSLRYRRPTPELREKFATMFRARITPSAALRLHKLDLEKEYGDKYPEVVKDAAKCPLLPWCYKVYYDICKKKVKDGKQKSSKRSSNSGKKKVAAKKRIGLAEAESTPKSYGVVTDLQSEKCRNVSHLEDNMNISKNVTIFNSPVKVDESQCDEVQSSINSLYQYEYMSDNMTCGNVVTKCENSAGLVNNNQILVTDGNLSDQNGLLNSENDRDFHDNNEILHHNDLGHFEDSCENFNDVIRTEDTLSVRVHNVENTADLGDISSTEVNIAAENLEQMFNNLRKKLLDKPGVYLQAVQKFVSNYEMTCKSNNSNDLNKALCDFGCKNSSSCIMPLSATGNGFPKIVEDFMDSRKVCAGVLDSSKPSESPKRKVLVLRMNPNRFNKILSKVSANQSKNDLVNI